ncbi:MAG: carbon-nitrogen hydrolase family protein, partial [Candidatus Hodarchaeota archaeon]
DIRPGEVETNLRTVHSTVIQAKKQQSDLIVFPELVTSGYAVDLLQYADPMTNNSPADQIRVMAQENELWIAFGFPEQIRGQRKLFNTLALVDSQGVVREKYHKIHLFTPMNDHVFFQSGTELKILKTDFGTIGLSTCYDLRFPEMYRLLAHKGAELILCPAQWPCPRQKHWDTLLCSRAIENQVFMIGVNRVGQTSDFSFCGGSGVFNAFGKPLLHLSSEINGVKSVDINVQSIQDLRNYICYLDDARFSINFP